MQLNIVYSIGKTASTSLFTSWGSQPECLPVVHTHDLRFFCIVDRDGTPFVRNLVENHPGSVFGVRTPSYLPAEGYTEFRFSLTGELNMSNAFPKSIFKTTKIIGVLRHPVDRRVSQFLNSTTVESVNAYIDTNRIGAEHVSSASIVEDLSRIAKCVPKHRMLTELAAAVAATGRLPRADGLEPVFRRFFCGRHMDEYTPYLRKLDGMFPGSIDPAAIKRHGGQEVRQDDMHLLLVKMEDMRDFDAAIKRFTGIKREIRHDRKIEEERHFIDGELSEVKRDLKSRFALQDMYPAASAEMSLANSLGYV